MAEKVYPHQDLTEKIIGAAIEVHRALGPGSLESIYQTCLAHEMTLRGLRFEKENHYRLNTKASGSKAVIDWTSSLMAKLWWN